MRILIVDDMPLMRAIITNLLREMGVTEYSEAENGNSALRMLKKSSYDLVLSDWNMPGMDGLALVHAMKADKELSHIPVLMITAERNKENVIAIAKAGADGYLVKPFNASTLSSKISHILAKHNLVIKKKTEPLLIIV